MKLSLLEWKLLQWLKEDRRSYTVGEGRAYLHNTGSGKPTRETEKLAIRFVKLGLTEPDLFGNMRLSDAGRRALELPRPEWKIPELPKIDDHDLDILNECAYASRSGRWVSPLDCGGSNRSEHSSVLKKLARHGLVEIRETGKPTGKTGDAILREPSLWRRGKGSLYYRATDAGRERLAQ
jgi:hypothetical protein